MDTYTDNPLSLDEVKGERDVANDRNIDNIEEEEEEMETDTLLSQGDKESSSATGLNSIEEGTVKEKANYNYPQHPLTEELACIPDMPGNFVRVGKLYVCCVKNESGYDKNNDGNKKRVQLKAKDLKCTVGPCWPMLLCTYSLIIGISSAAYFSYLPMLPWIFSFGGVTLLCVVVFALTKTACSNPGILPRVSEAPEGEDWRWNDSAQSYIPPGATYCQESQVIVYDYDHFCPWTGTTIAGGNMNYFSCFVSSLGILCVFVMFLSIAGSAAAIQIQHKHS